MQTTTTRLWPVTVADGSQQVPSPQRARTAREALVLALTESDDWSDEDAAVCAWVDGERMTRAEALESARARS